eukprot:3216213-Rhodomonas_salina.1
MKGRTRFRFASARTPWSAFVFCEAAEAELELELPLMMCTLDTGILAMLLMLRHKLAMPRHHTRTSSEPEYEYPSATASPAVRNERQGTALLARTVPDFLLRCTPKKKKKNSATSVQWGPGMRFLEFDFAVH